MNGFLTLALWGVVLGGLIGAVVGEKARGRMLLGLALGATLGPVLGPLVVLAMNDHRKRCSACRSLVDPLASVCPTCSRAIAPPLPTPPRLP